MTKADANILLFLFSANNVRVSAYIFAFNWVLVYISILIRFIEEVLAKSTIISRKMIKKHLLIHCMPNNDLKFKTDVINSYKS